MDQLHKRFSVEEAKLLLQGKVERSYHWLQDRIVRTCALGKLSSFEDVRAVLRDEVKRYNEHQVCSTIGEILRVHFEQARHG